MIAGPRLPVGDVGLAEQVVQLRVEPGKPYSGADPERVRQHAGPSVAVDRDHVGCVLAALVMRSESVDERQHTFGRVETDQLGELRDELGDTRKPAPCRYASSPVRHNSGIAPYRRVDP